MWCVAWFKNGCGRSDTRKRIPGTAGPRRSVLSWLRRRRCVAPILLLLPMLATACTVVWRAVEPHDVPVESAPAIVTGPVRAYLADGSVVVFPTGLFASHGVLRGNGTRYDLTLVNGEPFRTVPLDSVVAMEAFRQEPRNQAATVGLALLSIPVNLFVASLLLVAIFGSCPTIYAEVEGEMLLQSEPFSYSIASLFEARDVDRLRVQEDPAGVVRLELRNEAMETHYINHMELLEAVHEEGEEVISDLYGRPWALSDLRPPLSAVDRDGRDVLKDLRYADGQAFRSSRTRLVHATEEDFHDYLELEVPVTPGFEQIGLAFRYKNTLLNTVLFYDIMLARSGLGALDWLGSDLNRIGTAVEMGNWYQSRMGLRIEVEGEDGFVQVEQLPDAGPIAWTERTVAIPVDGESARVRIWFVSDSWFIDRVAVAQGVREPALRRIPVTRVTRADGQLDPQALADLADPDDAYLVTFPGERLHLEFEPARPATEPHRTLLLATQGYYVEWLRGDWLRDAAAHEPFRPSDGAILEAMDRWQEVMEDFERDFHASRIPVR